MMNAVSTAQFEALLRRLGPDRDMAGLRYEQLRRRLLTVFTYRRCPHPEDLADETLDRAARKLLEIGDRFEGSDPSRFVFGVAWNIARESFQRHREVPLPDEWDLADPTGVEDEDNARSRGESCLERCLRKLADADREMVLGYYQEEKRVKINRRTTLARDLGISANALRLRIHRITLHLRDCVSTCLDASKPRPVQLR